MEMDIMEPKEVSLNKILVLLALSLLSCHENEDATIQILPEVPSRFVLYDTFFQTDINGKLLHNDSLFSGYLIRNYSNNKIKSKEGFFEGLQTGLSVWYYSSGELKEKRFYNKNRKDGTHWGYYKDGSSRFEYQFLDGKYNGSFKEWYPDGSLFKDFRYRDNQEIGTQKAYRENGDLYINCVFVNGRRYGLMNSKPCYTVKDENGEYVSKEVD
jgi:antitoxin component YwqK of YwqJK toxin-antitoxin module